MRQEDDDTKLDPTRAFSMNKVNNINNFEKGLNTTIGFDYQIKSEKKSLIFQLPKWLMK